MRYEFDPADARRFAEIVGIHSFQKGNELTFQYCPYCKGSEKDKKTFSINMDTGVFQCFRSSCGVKGNMIRLAKEEVRMMGADSIDADMDRLGLKGSPTKVKKIDNVVLAHKDAQQVEPTEAALNELVAGLMKDHIIG